MSTEWITDRLPTAHLVGHYVYVTTTECNVVIKHACEVKSGEPWAYIPKPKPSAEVKRWTMYFDSKHNAWFLYDRRSDSHHQSIFAELRRDESDAAQRIEDLFNEVMP
jgi:hypothetical protein